MPTKKFKQKIKKLMSAGQIPPYAPYLDQVSPRGAAAKMGIVTVAGNQFMEPAARTPFDWTKRYGGWGPHGGGAAEILFQGHRGQPLFPYENPQSIAGEHGRKITNFRESY